MIATQSQDGRSELCTAGSGCPNCFYSCEGQTHLIMKFDDACFDKQRTFYSTWFCLGCLLRFFVLTLGSVGCPASRLSSFVRTSRKSICLDDSGRTCFRKKKNLGVSKFAGFKYLRASKKHPFVTPVFFLSQCVALKLSWIFSLLSSRDVQNILKTTIAWMIPEAIS